MEAHDEDHKIRKIQLEQIKNFINKNSNGDDPVLFGGDFNISDKIKISKEVFIILQYYIEQFIIKILYNSNFLAIHSGRIKIISTDIAFVSYLLNESKNPYNSEINNQDSDVLSINYQEHLDSYIDDIEIMNDETVTIED